MENLKHRAYTKDDTAEFTRLADESITARNQAKMLCAISEAHLFQNTKQAYFPLGEDMFAQMLTDLRKAEYIFVSD